MPSVTGKIKKSCVIKEELHKMQVTFRQFEMS